MLPPQDARPIRFRALGRKIASLVVKRSFQTAVILSVVGAISALSWLLISDIAIRSRFELDYGGVFLLNLLGAATILVPVPGDAFNIQLVCLLKFKPLWVGIASGAGSGIGELSSYLVGRYLGSCYYEALSRKRRLAGFFRKAERWLQKFGALAVFLFAAPYLPFDVMGITTGFFRYPLWKVAPACMAGRLARCLAVAFLAAYFGGLLPSHLHLWNLPPHG